LLFITLSEKFKSVGSFSVASFWVAVFSGAQQHHACMHFAQSFFQIFWLFCLYFFSSAAKGPRCDCFFVL
jgi:hypothetical protein